LDMNIASHVIKGDIPAVRKRLLDVPIHSITVSAVTQAELLYSVAKRGQPPVISPGSRVPDSCRGSALDTRCGERVCRASCEAEGITLAPLDMMIAAHAKARCW